MARVALLLPLLLLAACRSQPTTSRDLAERMLERFDANIGDATAFTVAVSGHELRYTLSADSSAAERFLVSIVPMQGMVQDPLVQAMVTSYLPNVPLLAATFADSARAATPLIGPVSRGGADVYAADASDVAPDSAGGTPNRARLAVYVDATTFQVREVERTVRIDSLARPLSLRLFYEDYRTVDGVTLPHRIRVRQDGFEQLLDERARTVEGGQLTLQSQQLRQMPSTPERAAMIEGIERRLRALTEGVEEATAEVTRVTVQRAGRE